MLAQKARGLSDVFRTASLTAAISFTAYWQPFLLKAACLLQRCISCIVMAEQMHSLRGTKAIASGWASTHTSNTQAMTKQPEL